MEWQVTVAIEVEHLTRTFHEPAWPFRRLRQRVNLPAIALDDVHLVLDTGESVALVGPNGAGKSTLLRVLATLVLPDSGIARVLGHDVVRDPAAVRRSIGVTTSDDRSFFWRLSGRDNLRFFATLQGVPDDVARRRIDELLERLGLTDAADRRFSGYSSGMRQRLSLARALLHQPPVLLLDEPTANLDLEHRGQVFAILKDTLATGRVTALIASHDAGLALAVSGRTIRLERGRVVQEDSIQTHVRYTVRVRGLSVDQRIALGVVETTDGDVLSIDDLGDGHALAGVIAAIVSGGGEVLAVEMPAGVVR